MGMGRGYPNPPGMGMRFNFSSPLGMGRIMGKYIRIRYEDGECKIRHHPAPLQCLANTIESGFPFLGGCPPDIGDAAPI